MHAVAAYTANSYGNVTSADVNNDGLLDILADTDLFFGLADGGLSGPISVQQYLGGVYILGDVNGDGLPDLVVLGWKPTIFLNDGDGGFSGQILQPDVTLAFDASGGLVADINGDGIADIVIGETAGAEALIGLGDGQFVLHSLPVPDAEFTTPAYGGWGYIGGIVVADFNQDGLQDVALVGLDTPLLVLLQQSDGGFESTEYLPPILDPWMGGIGNLGGGLVLMPHAMMPPDLAAPISGFGVQVFHNLGDGTFADGGLFPIQQNSGAWITVGDFNGDCVADVAVSGAALEVLLGDGDGGFLPEMALSEGAGSFPTGVAAIGPVVSPRALAAGGYGDGGLSVFGDPSRR
jgi:hypothetical protein